MINGANMDDESNDAPPGRPQVIGPIGGIRSGQIYAPSIIGTPPRATPDADLLLSAIITVRGKHPEGELVEAVGIPWFRILRGIERDPDFLFQFAIHPRKFEEFIAAAYELSGWTDVVLTPQSGDRGRDIIVTANMPGLGAIHFLDETKAYSPGRKVTAKDVSRMVAVLSRDQNVSKGIVTTTADFAPGVFEEFKQFIPSRLELKGGKQLHDWLRGIRPTSME
jgi:restriction system protein